MSKKKPQQNGDPGTKPSKALTQSTMAAQALARKAVELAQAGNVAALKLCLDLLSPPSKERLIALKLPQMQGVKNIPKALATILKAVARGKLSPAEGQAMAAMVEAYRKGIELTDIEARLAALEDRTAHAKY